jgi:hypothetical protein
MPILSLDDLSLYGLAWTFSCYQANTHTPAYGMLGHLPVHFTNHHIAS